MFTITDLKARQIFDSRGNPTVEADIQLDHKVIGRASVPSGASVGTHEAIELRDHHSKRYCGMGVALAVENINKKLSPYMVGKSFSSQQLVDEFIIDIDGTSIKSNLGANAILAVSIAFAKAMALALEQPLFRTISGGAFTLKMPTPMFNIINGGVHANNALDIQEFMIIPIANNIVIAIEMAMTVIYKLKEQLRHRGYSISVGDEGGFAPDFTSPTEALEAIIEAIQDAGYVPGQDICLALDIASNELHKGNGRYHWLKKGLTMHREQMVKYYTSLVEKYPIISIEDPFAEDDITGWSMITTELGNKIQLVGDDLFVTNVTMLQRGIDSGIANALLVKMNQVGTITETIQAISLALKHGYSIIISHRSGETEDTTLSHLAVSTGSKYIKAGSLCRTERVCKYNELLRIHEKLLLSHYPYLS